MAAEIAVEGHERQRHNIRRRPCSIDKRGDSCHPMLPYLVQGAAQSCEDAAALRAVLLNPNYHLETALEQYQEIRRPRASLVQSKTREHQ